MARYTANSNATGNAESRALDRFCELLIDKIKNIEDDWQCPWFSEGAKGYPRNLSGRAYNGGNSLMLMLQAEKEGYTLPVWSTFNGLQKLNEDKNLDPVLVKKGEKSFPVFMMCFTVIDKTDGNKIDYDDYRKLPDEEKKRYNVYPKTLVYNVFNVAAQTNLHAVRPELYDKLAAGVCGIERSNDNSFRFPAIDAMITNNAWVCRINAIRQNHAYYSPKRDEIVVPEMAQFKDNESFYGTLLHEMVHSTGADNRLGRLKSMNSSSPEYGREELVAEIGAALVGQQHGITKHLKDDSAAYLKAWLNSLSESPEFIKTVMNDVKKATSMVNDRILAVQTRLDNNLPVEPYKPGVTPSAPHVPKPSDTPTEQVDPPAEAVAHDTPRGYHR